MFPSIIVAESYNSAQYLLYCFRRNLNIDWITMIIAMTILFVITSYQIYSNRVSIFINQALACFKILILLIISTVGLVKLRTNSFNWNNIFNASFDFGAFGRGLIKVLLTYEGWNNINYLIGEFNPRPDNLQYPSIILKYSSPISVCITFIICFLSNAAFITVVGYNPNYSTYNESTPMPMRFGQEIFGEPGKNFMSLLVSISTFGCVSALIFTYSRIIKYASETGFIPSLFRDYNRNLNTLVNQLCAQFLYCFILSFIFLIKMDYNISDFLSGASQYAFIIYHGASALCLYIIRIRLRDTNPRFSISIYMVIIYLFIIIFLIIALLVPPRDGSYDYLISYCISWVAIALGIIIWDIRNRIKNQGPNIEI
ncbi:amino acid transporter [Gigaspora margarita]|nr:amino acid transporter [Gigaspora margarita]